MGTEKITGIGHRIYSDFFMPSRLGEYRSFLEEAQYNGFTTHSVSSFWELISRDEVDSDARCLILRHDIDTGVKTAKRIWQIEKSLGITGSFYFRLSTIDIGMMKEIAEKGGEASYHYEEIATVAKQKGFASKDEVITEMPGIRAVFRKNLLHLREETKLPMTIVASHGDFINRKLGIKNSVILDDPLFRKEMNIQLEVYDEKFINHFKNRYSDTHYPLFWKPSSPLEAIRSGSHAVYVLIHPRQWYADRCVNALDDLNRTAESFTYSFKKLRNPSIKFHSR